MIVDIAYLVPESFDYQIENFTDLVNIKLYKSIDELQKNVDKLQVDVIFIDDMVSSSFEEVRSLSFDVEGVKVYYLVDDSNHEKLTWAINQPWIDKIIPTDVKSDFALTKDVLAVAIDDSKLLLEYKQTLQDNRELEFVISQMLLVE